MFNPIPPVPGLSQQDEKRSRALRDLVFDTSSVHTSLKRQGDKRVRTITAITGVCIDSDRAPGNGKYGRNVARVPKTGAIGRESNSRGSLRHGNCGPPRARRGVGPPCARRHLNHGHVGIRRREDNHAGSGYKGAKESCCIEGWRVCVTGPRWWRRIRDAAGPWNGQTRHD